MGCFPYKTPACHKGCDFIRYFSSTIVTLACIVLIFYAIGHNYAALPGHPAVHYSLFFFVLVLLGYLEGLQVAILALERVDGASFRTSHPRAFVVHRLSTAQGGLNVQRFLVGRQFFVVFVVFLCAQLTTFPTLSKDGWPNWLFILIIDTGLVGALVVLAFGQLMPQLVAATHPVALMNLPGAWSVVQLALCFESLGVTHFSWLLAAATKRVCRLSPGGEVLHPVCAPAKRDTDHGKAAAGTKRTDAPPPLELDGVDLESGVESGGGGDGPDEPESDGSAIGDPSSSAATRNATDGDEMEGSSDRNGANAGEGEEGSEEDDETSRLVRPAWFDEMCVPPDALGLEQQLRDGADRGLAAAGAPSPTAAAQEPHGKARWLKAASERQPGFRDLFKSWGVTAATDEFPRPGAIMRHLAARGEPVPRYLLPPRHPQHIPPHVVAFDVVRRNRELRARLAALEAARVDE